MAYLTHTRSISSIKFVKMKDINERAIIERIRQLRRQYAGERGKSEFARALGISPSTYSYYENDRVPPIDVLVKMCEITRGDLEWLVTGSSGDEKVGSGRYGRLLGRLDRLLISNPELADAVGSFVELLCEKKGFDKQFASTEATPGSARPGWIPVLGRSAAGIVHFWDEQLLPERDQAITELDDLVKRHVGRSIVRSKDSRVTVDLQAQPLLDGAQRMEANLVQVSGESQQEVVEFVECEEIHNLFPDSFALQIDGDSMSPRINDGDIVLASPSVPAAQGHIAIARVANQIGVTCKLIRTTGAEVHLIPINERYETRVVPKKDLLWALAVLCHISV